MEARSKAFHFEHRFEEGYGAVLGVYFKQECPEIYEEMLNELYADDMDSKADVPVYIHSKIDYEKWAEMLFEEIDDQNKINFMHYEDFSDFILSHLNLCEVKLEDGGDAEQQKDENPTIRQIADAMALTFDSIDMEYYIDEYSQTIEDRVYEAALSAGIPKDFADKSNVEYEIRNIRIKRDWEDIAGEELGTIWEKGSLDRYLSENFMKNMAYNRVNVDYDIEITSDPADYMGE